MKRKPWSVTRVGLYIENTNKERNKQKPVGSSEEELPYVEMRKEFSLNVVALQG